MTKKDEEKHGWKTAQTWKIQKAIFGKYKSGFFLHQTTDTLREITLREMRKDINHNEQLANHVCDAIDFQEILDTNKNK